MSDRWADLRRRITLWSHRGLRRTFDVDEVAALLAERDALAAALGQAVRTLSAIEAQDFVIQHDATCAGCLGDYACDLGDWLDRVAAVRGELRAALGETP